jgi:hypothetical protein
MSVGECFRDGMIRRVKACIASQHVVEKNGLSRLFAVYPRE